MFTRKRPVVGGGALAVLAIVGMLELQLVFAPADSQS